MPEAIGLVVLFPLLGFLIITLFGARMSEKGTAYLACLMVGLAFLAAVVTALTPLLSNSAWGSYGLFNYDWTVAGNWRISFGLAADPLSATMALVVTGVGFLIHVYSVGYMTEVGEDHLVHYEKDYRRFFAYLNLFVFAMLVLVSSDNFVWLLVGWGNVGLASFLLIGFYKNKPSAVAAARKAFVMNSIGDVGLLLGIFVLMSNTGSASFSQALNSPALRAGEWRDWAAMLLLVAAVAKSAQIPLQTWLPDAMEGPTPVSALIHAATMVTAGVYLVVRAHPLFGVSTWAVVVIPVVGAFTAFYAASCALAQTDLKRVLAYSTMSQLGYMFMAAGVGAYEAAMFHLVTHAFFKALLFLSAGSVIHALGGEQDMRRMGGLRGHKEVRVAWAGFVVGALALSGIPPLAGFFSKEAILGTFPLFGQTTTHYNPLGMGPEYLAIIGWTGLLVAFMTAFYMFRAYMLVFEGPASELQPHASPRSMNFSMSVLTVLTLAGGCLAMPGLWNFLTGWFKPVYTKFEGSGREVWYHIQTDRLEVFELILGVGAGFAGMVLAVIIYSLSRQRQKDKTGPGLTTSAEKTAPLGASTRTPRRLNPVVTRGFATSMAPEEDLALVSESSRRRVETRPVGAPASGVIAPARSPKFNPLKMAHHGATNFLLFGWGFDLLYNLMFVWPGKLTARLIARWLDPEAEKAYDYGLGGMAWEGSKLSRKSETGMVRNYALGILFGAVAILAYVVVQLTQR